MNSRFTMAAHVMGMLTHAERDELGPVTSERMAGSIQTNPVVVRRLVASLARAGLVSSKRGTRGGVTLARDPRRITLLDIYRAVEEDAPLFGRYPSGPNPECRIGPHVAAYLEGVFGRARAALEHSLANVTLHTMYRELVASVRGREPRKLRRA